MLLQLLRQVDKQQALDISGIPDPELQTQLTLLLTNLGLVSSRRVGCTPSRLKEQPQTISSLLIFDSSFFYPAKGFHLHSQGDCDDAMVAMHS